MRASSMIRSISVSPINETSSFFINKRSARDFNCFGLSSPETYNVFAVSIPRTICIRSVDFPIPGSPPMRTSEPCIIPPPRTLSNSAIPVNRRSSSLRVISDNFNGRAAPEEP